MHELAEQLLNLAPQIDDRESAQLCREAASEITRLEAVNAELVAVCKLAHEEFGPAEWRYSQVRATPFWQCQSCEAHAPLAADIQHDDDCLWIAIKATLTHAQAPAIEELLRRGKEIADREASIARMEDEIDAADTR